MRGFPPNEMEGRGGGVKSRKGFGSGTSPFFLPFLHLRAGGLALFLVWFGLVLRYYYCPNDYCCCCRLVSSLPGWLGSTTLLAASAIRCPVDSTLRVKAFGGLVSILGQVFPPKSIVVADCSIPVSWMGGVQRSSTYSRTGRGKRGDRLHDMS